MKYFKYTIKNDEITEYTGEVKSIPPDYIEYKITLTGDNVYYKLTNNQLSDIIGEAMHEPAAKRRAEEFISGFNVSLV